MAVVTNLDFFARQSDQPFDIKFIDGNPVSFALFLGDTAGLENNNVAPFRPVKIIRQAIHKQMVSGRYTQFDHILPFVKKPTP